MNDRDYLFMFGVVCHVLGCAGTALGLCLQKGAHIALEGTDIPYYKSRKWVSGISVYLGSQVLTGVAFMFAAQSALAPLLPSTLVANSFFANRILGEEVSSITARMMTHMMQILWGRVLISRISKYDIRGTVLMFFGAGFVVAGAPIVDPPSGELHADLPGLFVSYLVEPVFILCACFITATGCTAFALVLKNENKVPPSAWPVAGNTFLSGIYSGLTVTFFRASTLMLKNAFNNDRTGDLLNWRFWMMLFFAAITGVAMVHCLNLALKFGQARIVVPINIAFSLVFQVVLGLFYWQEYDSFEEVSWIVYFCVGVVLSVASALYPSMARGFDDALVENDDDPENGDKLGKTLSIDTASAITLTTVQISDFDVEAVCGSDKGEMRSNSHLLAAWMKSNSDLFPFNSSFLELGANSGAPSIVAIKHLRAGRATVTNTSNVVPTLQRNIQRHIPELPSNRNSAAKNDGASDTSPTFLESGARLVPSSLAPRQLARMVENMHTQPSHDQADLLGDIELHEQKQIAEVRCFNWTGCDGDQKSKYPFPGTRYDFFLCADDGLLGETKASVRPLINLVDALYQFPDSETPSSDMSFYSMQSKNTPQPAMLQQQSNGAELAAGPGRSAKGQLLSGASPHDTLAGSSSLLILAIDASDDKIRRSRRSLMEAAILPKFRTKIGILVDDAGRESTFLRCVDEKSRSRLPDSTMRLLDGLVLRLSSQIDSPGQEESPNKCEIYILADLFQPGR